jgi:hypothetical protein
VPSNKKELAAFITVSPLFVSKVLVRGIEEEALTLD